MNREEAVLLVAQRRAAWDLTEPPPGAGETWYLALQDLDYEDVSVAMTALSMTMEKPCQPAHLRNEVRRAREDVAQREVAEITMRNDGRRHKMPPWFRTVFEQHRQEHAGEYVAMHEARRAKEKEEGKPLNAYQPLRFGASFGGSTERSPQDRAAGPDS